MVPSIKIPPMHKLALVPAGEAVTWRLGFKVLSFGRLSVQTFILLPAKVAVLPGANYKQRRQSCGMQSGAVGLERDSSVMGKARLKQGSLFVHSFH